MYDFNKNGKIVLTTYKGDQQMKLTFLGADHEVTGSCHYLNTNGKNILIDCGLEQGPDLYTNQDLSVNAAEIDFVLLTHAHIDHTGYLPRFCKQGFSGKIHCTDATFDLCQILLRDSAHLQEKDAEWANKKGFSNFKTCDFENN